MRLADRFHDPHLRAFLELLDEQAVVSRQVESRREEIIAVRFGLLVLALELLLVTLQVLDHEIFPRQFEMIPIVVDLLMRL